jgi:hypothetical protein
MSLYPWLWAFSCHSETLKTVKEYRLSKTMNLSRPAISETNREKTNFRFTKRGLKKD